MVVVDGDRSAVPSLVDAFKPYLIQRINEGCLKATTLHLEIRANGFTGSYAIIRKFVEQYRSNPDLTSVPRPPSVRQVTGGSAGTRTTSSAATPSSSRRSWTVARSCSPLSSWSVPSPT